MWTIDLLALVCPVKGCDKSAAVILKIRNGEGYILDEVYCRKHGQAVRDANKADWTKKGIEFKDLT